MEIMKVPTGKIPVTLEMRNKALDIANDIYDAVHKHECGGAGVLALMSILIGVSSEAGVTRVQFMEEVNEFWDRIEEYKTRAVAC